MTVNAKDEKTLGGLLSDLLRGINKMFRQEVDLLKAELTKKTKQKLKEISLLIVGGFILYAGFLLLLGAAVAALRTVAALWVSVLIPGAVLCGVGAVLVQRCLREIKGRGLKPIETLETLKEGKEWVKQQI
jgi:predicted ABC-type sugar transport system permease subunit